MFVCCHWNRWKEEIYRLPHYAFAWTLFTYTVLKTQQRLKTQREYCLTMCFVSFTFVIKGQSAHVTHSQTTQKKNWEKFNCSFNGRHWFEQNKKKNNNNVKLSQMSKHRHKFSYFNFSIFTRVRCWHFFFAFLLRFVSIFPFFAVLIGFGNLLFFFYSFSCCVGSCAVILALVLNHINLFQLNCIKMRFQNGSQTTLN